MREGDAAATGASFAVRRPRSRRPPARGRAAAAAAAALTGFNGPATGAEPPGGGDARLPAEWVERLERRYAPFADWRDSPLPAELRRASRTDAPERYWRTAEAIREARAPEAAPLAGLKVALDPGHVGGAWARADERFFQLRDKPPVREGDLALDVARAARQRLRELGADVALLRERAAPVARFAPEEKARLTGRAMAGDASAREAAAELDYAARELKARARRVNRAIRPDVLLSLHIDAAPWPDPEAPALVETNRSHALIYGAVMPSELDRPDQRRRLRRKLLNGSGPPEAALGRALGRALESGFGLPPAHYEGRNAVALHGAGGYAWARNLLILRRARCPAAMIEPFMANSEAGFAAIQERWPETRARYVGVIAGALRDAYGGVAAEE